MMVTTAPCAAAAQLTSGVFAIPSSDTNSLLSFDGLPPEKAHWITNAKLMDPDKAVCRVERWPPACLVDRPWGAWLHMLGLHQMSPYTAAAAEGVSSQKRGSHLFHAAFKTCPNAAVAQCGTAPPLNHSNTHTNVATRKNPKNHHSGRNFLVWAERKYTYSLGSTLTLVSVHRHAQPRYNVDRDSRSHNPAHLEDRSRPRWRRQGETRNDIHLAL